jgi:hypothetical protein
MEIIVKDESNFNLVFLVIIFFYNYYLFYKKNNIMYISLRNFDYELLEIIEILIIITTL